MVTLYFRYLRKTGQKFICCTCYKKLWRQVIVWNGQYIMPSGTQEWLYLPHMLATFLLRSYHDSHAVSTEAGRNRGRTPNLYRTREQKRGHVQVELKIFFLSAYNLWWVYICWFKNIHEMYTLFSLRRFNLN